MTLPMPGGGGSGLRFRLLGFPVRIDLTFVIVLGFLGLGGGLNVVRLAVWIGIGAVSVLAHELGHALVARTTGAHPTIDLYGFGGVTQYRPPAPLSRARQLAISLAGPMVGIVVGLVLWRAVPADPYAGSLAGYARNAAIFVNLGWGVLNLLPVLPLDGGTVLAELLPGDAAVRRRRAAAVSVATAALVAVVAITRGYIYGALLAGWLAVDNVRVLRPPAARQQAQAGETGDAEANQAVLWLVDAGQLEQARHLVETAPADRPVDQAVHGLVLALTGQPGLGRRLLQSAVSATPGNPTRLAAYARLLVHDGAWDQLASLAHSELAALVPPAVLAQARDGAYAEACRRSRHGDPDGALAALTSAVALGWQDGPRADTDPDLGLARSAPGYAPIRARMTATG